jgi:hypothetical protein
LQHPENKPVTENGKAGTKPEKQNLGSGFFLHSKMPL